MKPKSLALRRVSAGAIYFFETKTQSVLKKRLQGTKSSTLPFSFPPLPPPPCLPLSYIPRCYSLSFYLSKFPFSLSSFQNHPVPVDSVRLERQVVRALQLVACVIKHRQALSPFRKRCLLPSQWRVPDVCKPFCPPFVLLLCIRPSRLILSRLREHNPAVGRCEVTYGSKLGCVFHVGRVAIFALGLLLLIAAI